MAEQGNRGDGMVEKKKSLSDDEIVSEKGIARRSSLRLIVAGVVGTALAAVVGTQPREAKAQGETDSDTGPCADGAGHGRGQSDSDSGQCEDQPGHGRGAHCHGVSDSDSGPCEDSPNNGRSRPRH